MLVDVDALRHHLESINIDPEGPWVWGPFEELTTGVLLARARGGDHLDPIRRELRAVANRLVDVRTVPAKLNWMLGQRDDGHLEPYAWMFFASSDVDSFLLTMRSLFDHLGSVVQLAATKPGSVPPSSFRALREWCLKGPDRADELLGAEIAAAVRECDWFMQLRDLRDDLVHRDAETIVFPEVPGIAVQIYKGAHNLLDEAALIRDDGLVGFDRLVAATTARLHALLGTLSAEVAARIGVEDDGAPGRSQHSGLAIIRDWTDELLAALAAG